jgi:hypothetical protein
MQAVMRAVTAKALALAVIVVLSKLLEGGVLLLQKLLRY